MDNNNDQRKSNNQNRDRDYTEEQKKPGCLGKSSFLDKTWSPTLVISKKAFLDILEDIKSGTVISDTGKK